MAEIGAGMGTHFPLLAEVGSEVTIFDCSKKALEAGKRIFALQGIQASSMRNHALSLPNTPFMTDSISLCLLELLNILALPEIPFPLQKNKMGPWTSFEKDL